MQTSAGISVSVQCLSVRLRWLEANLFSSREAGAADKLRSKTLMARLLRLELLFFRAAREGGLLPRVECLEAFVFGAETGRAAAMAECVKVVSTIDCFASAGLETDDSASDGEAKWFEGENDEGPGMYRIRRSAVIVTNDLKCRLGVAGKLSRGQEVKVLKVALLKNEQLVRGRIAEPHRGWISLVSYETDFRWADSMINNTTAGNSDEQHVMQSDCNSTDSNKHVMESDPTGETVHNPSKRARLEQPSHLQVSPGYVKDLGLHKPPDQVFAEEIVALQSRFHVLASCVEDLGVHKSPAYFHAEEKCRQELPVLPDHNGKQDCNLEEVDPEYTFYTVLAYPNLGMNLQIGRTYTQAELEERGKCNMPAPLDQRELKFWECRRDSLLKKLKNSALFRKVHASAASSPAAFDVRSATACLIRQPSEIN